MSKKENNMPEKRQASHSERFQHYVTKEFSSLVGKSIELDEHQKRLVQNLFVKVDIALNDFEADRQKKNKGGTPIGWGSIDMAKMAVDGVHRIRLGLDALIPNHIHPIPYWNTKNAKYDLDLRIGYVGKDYYRRKVAVKEPKDIRYQLVHETDEFEPIMKSVDQEVENYRFKITKPFDRGDVVGGFGYIEFEDAAENKLVIVSEKEFKKVSNVAKASNFWNDWGDKMRYKTLVHRVTDELKIDPEKANSSVHYVESQDNLFIDDGEAPALPPQQPTEGRRSIDTQKPTEEAEVMSNEEIAEGTPFEGA